MHEQGMERVLCNKSALVMSQKGEQLPGSVTQFQGLHIFLAYSLSSAKDVVSCIPLIQASLGLEEVLGLG